MLVILQIAVFRPANFQCNSFVHYPLPDMTHRIISMCLYNLCDYILLTTVHSLPHLIQYNATYRRGGDITTIP